MIRAPAAITLIWINCGRIGARRILLKLGVSAPPGSRPGWVSSMSLPSVSSFF